MAQLVTTYVDLGNLNAAYVKAVLLRGPKDILQICQTHRSEGVTTFDQVMSAMSCVLRWSPTDLFDSIKEDCICEGQDDTRILQGVAFLGMCGLLVIAKSATELNKPYLVKRWMAYCSGESVVNELSAAGMDGMIRIVMGVQQRLHQTELGRAWAQRAIDTECNPLGLKAQILMVYDYVGMKAAQLMYKYIGIGPLVLVLPSVMEDCRRFKQAYDTLSAARGPSAFPYTRLMGLGDELNHAKFPDLYYCAVGYYKAAGGVGGKDGKFVKSVLETNTDASLLDKYYRITASGSGISDTHLTAWTANASELGGYVDEEAVKRTKRKLKRKIEESEDD